MHTHSLSEYVECLGRDDWQGVGELMLASANKLARIGAKFLICPDNTIHRSLPYVQARSPLPWLPVGSSTAASIPTSWRLADSSTCARAMPNATKPIA
jgi:aspartate racemase